MAKRLKILYIEDSEDDVALVLRLLRAAAYEPTYRRVDSAEALHEALEKETWDLIIGDYSIPNFSGTRALEIVRHRHLDIPFIFVSGTMGEAQAVEAMKAGAQDYIVKGNYKRLIPAIERELYEAQLRREHVRVERERQEMEEQLRQAQKMEIIGQLTGGVAHDFNNLLTVILGNLQMVEMALVPGSKVRAWAERATEAAMRGADLTNQLLAFSQRQVLNPGLIDLNETIEGMIDFMERTIGATVEIRTAFDPGVWPVYLDATLLNTAVLNLAINARDAMPHGGVLTLKTENATIATAQAARHPNAASGPYVALSVSDTGEGMSETVKQHLFEPFFTTKTRDRGTGLGLSMVYGFVSQSKGFIQINSELGKGTTVTLYFPQAPPTDSPAAAPLQADDTPHGTETILLVEDTELVRRTTSSMLRELGYRVVEAGNGPEALALLDGGTACDLLFTDVMMVGGMSGPDLAVAVLERLPATKVLFTSGFADTGRMGPMRPAADAQLISKPYRLSALARKIRTVLDQR